MNPKAYSYIRMSTVMQLKGDSLRRQTEKSRLYAEKNGLDLIETSDLQDIGTSAYTGANKEAGLGRFMSWIAEGRVEPGSYLLVESLDRLSREKVTVALTQLQSIIDAGVIVVTLIDEQVFKNFDDFGQLMVSIVSMHRAHEESKVKSQRLSAAWDQKRKTAPSKPLTKICPGWLRPTNKGFEVDKEKASVVQRVYEESLSGIGANTIARRLNEEKVSTFGKSKGWHESYIKKILKNRAVIGEYHPHTGKADNRRPVGEPIPRYYPEIISEQMFYSVAVAVEARLKRKGGRTGSLFANLFKGVLRCADCDGPVIFLNKGKAPKGGKYLQCGNGRRGLGCTKTLWRYEKFELAFLQNFHLAPEIGQLYEQRAGDWVGREETELAGLNAKLKALSRAAEQFDNALGTGLVSESSGLRRRRMEDELLATEAAIKMQSAIVAKKRYARQPSRVNFVALASKAAPDAERNRAMVSQHISEQVTSVEICFDGPETFLRGRKRDQLIADFDHEDAEDFFSPDDHLVASPAMAIHIRNGLDYLVQPHPFEPRHRRLFGRLRPTDEQIYVWGHTGEDGIFIPAKFEFKYEFFDEEFVPYPFDE